MTNPMDKHQAAREAFEAHVKVVFPGSNLERYPDDYFLGQRGEYAEYRELRVQYAWELHKAAQAGRLDKAAVESGCISCGHPFDGHYGRCKYAMSASPAQPKAAVEPVPVDAGEVERRKAIAGFNGCLKAKNGEFCQSCVVLATNYAYQGEDDRRKVPFAYPLASLPARRGVSECPACGGNDAEMPCCYPRPHEAQPGCLRNVRLSARKPSVHAKLYNKSTETLQSVDNVADVSEEEAEAVDMMMLAATATPCKRMVTEKTWHEDGTIAYEKVEFLPDERDRMIAAYRALKQRLGGKSEVVPTVSVAMFGSAELADELRAVAAAIHYPDCWDTAAYPTLLSALEEIGCSPADCTRLASTTTEKGGE